MFLSWKFSLANDARLVIVKSSKRESVDRAIHSVSWPHNNTWYMLPVVRGSLSDASLGWHSLLLWIVDLYVTSDVSTSSWANHAPIRVYAGCSKWTLCVCSSYYGPQRFDAMYDDFLNHLVLDEAQGIVDPSEWNNAFDYIQWYFKSVHILTWH